MTELVEDTEGVHKVLLTEEHTGLRVELAAHDIFIDDIITADLHLIDGRLRPFGDTHFEGDGVAHDVGLHGIDASEDIAIIIVEVADSILIYGETVLEALLVVDVPRADSQKLREQLGGVLRIPDEADILDIVLLPFVDLEVDVYLAGTRDGYNAIAHQLGVAIARSLVALDEVLQVLLVVRVDELLLLEDLQQRRQTTATRECEAFVRLPHRHTQLVVREGAIPLEVDVTHLGLAAAVDVEGEVHIARLARSLSFLDSHLHLAEALLIVVLLDELAGTVEGIGRDECTLLQARALLELLTISLGDTREGSLGETWTLGQGDLQEDLIPLVLIDEDADIGEVTRLEEAVHRRGQCGPWDLDLVPHIEAGEAAQDEVIIARRARDLDLSDGLRHGALVADGGRDDDRRSGLRRVSGQLRGGMGCGFHCTCRQECGKE